MFANHPHDPNLITNKNLLQQNKRNLTILKMPEVMFTCFNINLPGCSVQAIERKTPLGTVQIPGTKLNFDQSLTVSFFLDEDLRNYSTIFKWMQGLGRPESGSQYTELMKSNPLYDQSQSLRIGVSDLTISLLTNTYQPNKNFIFYEAFPINLSNLTLETNVTEPQPINCSVTFAFREFVLETVV